MSMSRTAVRSSIGNASAEDPPNTPAVLFVGFSSGERKHHTDFAPLYKRLKINGVTVTTPEDEFSDQRYIVSAIIDGGGSAMRIQNLVKFFEAPTVQRALHSIILCDKLSDQVFTRNLSRWLTKWPDAVFARSQNEVVTLVLQQWINAGRHQASSMIESEPKSIGSLPRMLELGEVLRDPQNHELDAKRVADLFGLKYAEIARWAGVSPQFLDQSPTAEALQPVLRLLERVARLRIMRQIDEKGIRQWFRTPLPRLEQRTPFDLFKNGAGARVANLVDNLVTGQFS